MGLKKRPLPSAHVHNLPPTVLRFMQLTTIKATQLFHILRQLSIIAANILLAKSALDVARIGMLEMLLFIGYAVSFFWVAGSVQGLLTIYPKLNGEEQQRFLFQVYLLFLGVSVGVGLVLWPGQDLVLRVLVGQEELPYFNLFLWYWVLHTPSFLLENIYLLKNRPWPILWFGLFSFVLYPIVILLPIYLGWNFEWSFVGLIVLAFGKHLWLLVVLRQEARWVWQPQYIRRLLKVSTPLIFYALIGGLAQILDNWLVGWYYEGDEEQFAIFRYGARELPMALAMAAALSNALLPTIVQDLPSALEGIKRRSRKLFHLLFPLSILAALFSYQLYPVFFSEAFLPSAAVFNVFLLTLVSRLVFPHTILMALERNSIIVWVSVVELVVNVGCSLWFVQYFGLSGIAMGTVVAYTFEKVVYIIYLKKNFGIAFQHYTDLRWLGFYSVALFVAFLMAG